MINLSKPFLDNQDAMAAFKAVESGWLTQNGTDVKLMEVTLNEYFREKTECNEYETTTTSNGTTALHLALIAAGVKEGDEVIISDFSYVAVANAVLYCNAIPIFADIDFQTWNIDFNDLRTKITNKTRAIIAVDNYGREINYEKLKAVVPNHISIIRDACESFPFKNDFYQMDEIVVVSFYANKIITSGEGGAIFGSKNIIEKIRILKNQGVEKSGNFEHTVLGFNYRISNLHAAIFNSQWKKKNTILRERQRVFDRYQEKIFERNSRVQTNIDATPWLFTLRIPGVDFQTIRKMLFEFGIETRPGFTPFSQTSYLKEFFAKNNSKAHEICREIIALPTYPELKDKEIDFIVEKLFDCL